MKAIRRSETTGITTQEKEKVQNKKAALTRGLFDLANSIRECSRTMP
jgi:hypothetical protein